MNVRKRVAVILHTVGNALMPNPYGSVPQDPYGNGDDMVMADFRADRFGGSGNVYAVPTAQEASAVGFAEATKIAVSPKSVVDELKRPPTSMALDALDAKIAILKKKSDLITQRYSREHVEFLIIALTGRKKYDARSKAANITYREYFSRFDVTDEVKISALLEKYDLRMESADLFVPEFPDEAIEVMDLYAKVVKEIAGKFPRFYVIATPADFQKKLDKRDPILLAQSPFGMYYYILGAWDKEMIYLPEL